MTPSVFTPTKWLGSTVASGGCHTKTRPISGAGLHRFDAGVEMLLVYSAATDGINNRRCGCCGDSVSPTTKTKLL